MQRRKFLTVAGASSLALTGAAVPTAAQRDERTGQSGDQPQAQRQCYELRRYRLESEDDRRLVDDYLAKALMPAYSELGVEPIGAFTPVEDANTRYVLIPYQSPAQLIEARAALPDNASYQQAAEPYLSTPIDAPAYDRFTSSLMVAFAGFPTLQVPPQKKQNRDRLFELRTYESHNERKARLKVEMFNKAEMDIFDDLGFTTVFYGDTLIGDRLPNLTYMLVYDDRQQRDQLWQSFVESPAWEELSARQRYEDTVSQVHSWFLKPTSYSQL